MTNRYIPGLIFVYTMGAWEKRAPNVVLGHNCMFVHRYPCLDADSSVPLGLDRLRGGGAAGTATIARKRQDRQRQESLLEGLQDLLQSFQTEQPEPVQERPTMCTCLSHGCQKTKAYVKI